MNVIVRLYWQHDLDLVALTLHPMFEMGKWMKKAMIAYAQGDEEFHIPLPPEMPPEKPLENSDAHFALDPKNEIENEVIKILQQFRNGQRNSVIKLIFRNYLDELFLKPYIDTNTYIVKARGNYGVKKKENNISIPSVTKRTAKTITKAEKASNASNAQTTTPPEEESSKEPDHKQLSNLSLSNSIDKKAKNTTPPDLKPDTNFINKENISKNTESASYDEKNMEKDEYHEKEMLPEKEEDLHTSSASETFENSGSESFGDDGFDLFSSIENLI